MMRTFLNPPPPPLPPALDFGAGPISPPKGSPRLGTAGKKRLDDNTVNKSYQIMKTKKIMYGKLARASSIGSWAERR